MIKLLIYGLFGGDNFGDELFSKVIVERINETDSFAQPAVFTESEELTRLNVDGFDAITSFPIPNGGLGTWYEAFGAYRRADGLLFGGGGLFNEVFLRAGIPGKGIVLATARLFNLPYVLHGIEIGFVGSSLNKYITAWSLRHARRVIVRNQGSIDRARTLAGVTPELGVDINHGWLQRKMSPPSTRPAGEPRRLVVNMAHSLALEDATVTGIMEDRKREGYRVVFIANNQSEYDKVAARFTGLADEIVLAPTVASTTEVLQGGDAFLTERFHFTMAALHANRPTTVIVSSSKVRELLEYVGQAGATLEIVRPGGEVREIIAVNGSPEQAAAVARWAERSDAQLGGVIDAMQATEQGEAGTLNLKYLPVVLGFYAIFGVYYIMDRFKPLNRYLDLKKT